ncbi:MAG: DNA-binding protein WhiA [Firmicutes bacterium]|nr:DNA-binding protein WhiA [Bacillota bacterium]
MAFSLRVKEELARVIPKDSCCQLAELSALIHMDGALQIHGQAELALEILTENAAAARKIFHLVKNLFHSETEILVRKKRRLRKNNVYGIRIPAGAGVREILLKLGLVDDDFALVQGISLPLVKRKCCRRAYLRGAFLGKGSITDPEKTYHLEFTVDNPVYAGDLSRLLHSQGVPARVGERKKEYVVYIKEGEQIGQLLALMGAHTALLDFENIRVIKGMRNQVNRRVNCETANLDKTVNAAMQQLENIRVIDEMMGLSKLPANLREVARLRMGHPDASLQELGEMLVPPASKSGVNHRLRRIGRIAEQLRTGARLERG